MKKQLLTIVSLLLMVAGAVLLYLGFTSAPKIIWPPVVSGFGFFIIAVGFWVTRK